MYPGVVVVLTLSLRSIYINDLLKLRIKEEILSCAVDTCILYKHVNADIIKVNIENDLTKTDAYSIQTY